MDSVELLRVIQSFSEFIIAAQSSLYRVGGHEARRGIIGRLRKVYLQNDKLCRLAATLDITPGIAGQDVPTATNS